MPRTLAFADRIPSPHRTRLNGFAVSAHAPDFAVHRLNPHPFTVPDALLSSRARIDEQIVMRMYLSQPRVLRIPRVVHCHRSLSNRVERVLVAIARLRFN